MAANTDIKTAIAAVFKTNGTQDITGANSQSSLLALIDAIGAAQNGGLISSSYNPATQTNKGHKFYYAATPGYYIHFGHTVLVNQFVQFTFNHSTNAWDKTVLLTLSSGGGSGVYEVTVAELQTAIENEALVAGALYMVTDADVNLYGGTTIYLKANSTTELDTENAAAKLYVPKYESVPIWSATGIHALNDVVAWGGMLWTNKTGSVGSSTDIFTLDSTNWEVIAYNTDDYRIISVAIKYDLLHDKILYMCEKNTIEVSMTMETLEWATNNWFNPIKAMRWGYCDSDIFDSVFSDIRVTDSYFEAINLPYITVNNIYLSHASAIRTLEFTSETVYIRYITLNQSYIYDMKFGINSTLSSVFMTNSYLYEGEIEYGSISGQSMIHSTLYKFQIIGIDSNASNFVNNTFINSTVLRFKLTSGYDADNTQWQHVAIGYTGGVGAYDEIPHYHTNIVSNVSGNPSLGYNIIVQDFANVQKVIPSTTFATAGSTDLVNDTTPQLGGNLDLNGKSIDYGAILSTNGTYQGDIMSVTVDTNGVGFGALLAQGADFHYDEADADAAANCYGLVIALETGTGTKKVLMKGEVCNTDWNWSAGFIYASTTQGTLTQTKPTGTDDVTVIVGYALSADTMWFAPYAYYQEHV